MKKKQGSVPSPSATTTSCAFIFDRLRNGILSIFRAVEVFTMTAAGTGTVEGEMGASMTRKDGAGDGGIDRSDRGCWIGAGDDEKDFVNQPVRVGGLELGTRAGRVDG